MVLLYPMLDRAMHRLGASPLDQIVILGLIACLAASVLLPIYRACRRRSPNWQRPRDAKGRFRRKPPAGSIGISR